jgi:hypothetical protein
VVRTRRLAVAKSLPLAAVLVSEMEQFTMKVSAETGNETYESWRDREHDDIVLALALAVWWGEYASRRIIFGCSRAAPMKNFYDTLLEGRRELREVRLGLARLGPMLLRALGAEGGGAEYYGAAPAMPAVMPWNRKWAR